MCGGTLSGTSGRFQSPDYATGSYPNNLDNCDVTISVDQGHVVKVTFEEFDVEEDGCQYDYLQVNLLEDKSFLMCVSVFWADP